MTVSAVEIAAALIAAEESAPVVGQVLDPGQAVSFTIQARQGDPGPVGPQGDQGRSIYAAMGAPSVIGSSGDLFIDVESGDVWQLA